ncbi:hypothetical protein BS47DRAFT_1045299 [Hydnum rufescens UP504]|uniref:Uncharacterized protein n=1 Tax=Hydnum rufescens UP504 TaxID=1448309 RepID=A0A9P6AXG3_9AGAM|nr:hypothetical protein BS47DRAFT_1045299 [Hydnum rufescens UP504]
MGPCGSAEIKEHVQDGRGRSLRIQDLQLSPWIVACKVPLDDRPLSREGKLRNPVECADYQSFFRPDRMNTLTYYLDSMDGNAPFLMDVNVSSRVHLGCLAYLSSAIPRSSIRIS